MRYHTKNSPLKNLRFDWSVLCCNMRSERARRLHVLMYEVARKTAATVEVCSIEGREMESPALRCSHLVLKRLRYAWPGADNTYCVLLWCVTGEKGEGREKEGAVWANQRPPWVVQCACKCECIPETCTRVLREM